MDRQGEPTSSSSTGPANAPRLSRPGRPRLRVPILAIILVVATCAMAFAALRTASQAWLDATYTLTVVLLLVAVLAARFRRGDERAFWFGFAVFGWGFFVLGYHSWADAFRTFGVRMARPAHSSLLTTPAVEALVPVLRKGTNALRMIDEITVTTIRIASLLVVMVLGIVGGLLAILFRRRSRSRMSAHVLAVPVGLALVGSIMASIEPARAMLPYFPAGVFDESGDGSDLSDEWYSRSLDAMGEPSLLSLSQQDPRATVYRLLWLPTSQHPVCVRIEWTGDGAQLHARVLDGQGGFDSGHVAIDRKLRLNGEQWAGLERLVEQSRFWELPTHIKDDDAIDGDQLLMEGVRAGKYHAVDQNRPDQVSAELCRYMLDLTQIELSREWNEYVSGGVLQ